MTKKDVATHLYNEYHENLYRGAYESLKNRIHDDGYTPTSVTGAYPGMFIRDASIQIMAFVEFGDLINARKILDYIISHCQKAGADRAPHIIFQEVGEKGKPVSYPVEMMNQPDQNYMFVTAWLNYCETSNDDGFCGNTYPFVEKWAEYYLSDEYLNDPMKKTMLSQSKDKSGNYYLIRNKEFEHSREGRYWDCYDLITNCFAGESLSRLSKTAETLGKKDAAQRFKEKADMISQGINHFLITTYAGTPIYGEMLVMDGRYFQGFSWVNLAPIAANWKVANDEIMRNTFIAYYRTSMFDWDQFQMMSTDTVPESNVIRKDVIGKGLAWEMLFCMKTRSYRRLILLLDFLETYNRKPDNIYGESFWYDNYKAGKPTMSDPGNQEHASWYLYAISKIRKEIKN
ncbi:hypothetical protein JW926_09625 [Candidatus Sumerlaeota bacterium]|nr:hypothetical protein [Candidatus Sumerlaeota bacterium]